ncbi:MAG: GAF domain-containing protein [candidate division NC10 bacterium]
MEDPILQHLGEGVLETDARGRVLGANRAATKLLWMSGVTLLGATLATLWGQNANVVDAAIARLAGPDPPEREVLELAYGQRHLRLTLTLLSPKEGSPGFLAVVQDITELNRRIEELNALNHVATILNSAHDLQKVLELAIERISATLHAEAASLLLRNDATGELVFEVALGPVAHRLRGRRLRPGQGIAGWVAKTGEALLVPDVSFDPRFSGGIDKTSGFVTRSILCTPLKTSQGIIGVVQLLNRVDERPFSQEDLQLLEAISLHAAAVIEQARLLATLRRQIEELDALNHVSTILNSTHDLQRVLELAIERVSAALHAEAGSLLLRDDTTGDLVFRVAVGPVADWLRGRRLPAGQGIAGWVTKSGEAVLVTDTRADPRFSDTMDKAVGFVTRSILSAPLKTSRGIIGVVELLNHVDGHPFTRADLQFLETIALHAATVIEQARLLEREKVSHH